MTSVCNNSILANVSRTPVFVTHKENMLQKSKKRNTSKLNCQSGRSKKEAFLYVNMAGFLAEQVEEKTVKVSVQASS